MTDTATRARLTSELIQAASRVRQVAVDGADGADERLRLVLNEVRSAANAIERTIPAEEPLEERIVTRAARLRQALEGRHPSIARERLKELLDELTVAEQVLYQPAASRAAGR